MRAKVWVPLLILIALGVFAVSWRAHSSRTEAYQAVFLNNGQVYFGKLEGTRSAYEVLKDVYYLQVAPAKAGESTAGQLPTNAINLVKLGSELHGPADMMKINRANILFIEDLRQDSKVTQAISDMKKNGQ